MNFKTVIINIIIFNFIKLVFSQSFENCENDLNALIYQCLYGCESGTWKGSTACSSKRNYDICKESAKKACDAYKDTENRNNGRW